MSKNFGSINKESKFYTVLFTFVVTFIFVFVLSSLNNFTSQKAKENQQIFKVKAILNAVGIQYSSNQEAMEKFKSSISRVEITGYELYKTIVENGEVYAIVFNGSGLWGNISGVLAVDKNVTKIVGIDFVSQSETPGLGGRIDEKWFKEQFRNEKIINNSIVLSTTKAKESKDDGMVDAITGATLTSKYVEKIIKEYIPILKQLLGVS
ncbi:MAG: FMN-binding protein [Fervidobacterium sp.]